MFGKQLLGLALSALLTVFPVDTIYGGNNITFPFSRVDSIYWSIEINSNDLGPRIPADSAHVYQTDYTVDIYCSSACTLAFPTSDMENISESHVKFHFSTTKENITPTTYSQSIKNLTLAGRNSQTNNYVNENSFGSVQISFTHDDGSWASYVMFPAVSSGQLLGGIYYYIRDFELNWWAHQVLVDKDLPSSVIQTVNNYLNNEQYQEAQEYINNYYYENSVETNEDNETIINNYQTTNNSLNQYFNTENNFTNQIETDFQNQEQQLPDLDNSIEDLQTPSFLSSANWVTQQFNRMTSGNIYGSFLIFSLLTGFITALIGRFKR